MPAVCPVQLLLSILHCPHPIICGNYNLSNKSLIFQDFQGSTIEFHDFPGLENEILKFHDFLARFSMTCMNPVFGLPVCERCNHVEKVNAQISYASP